MFEISCVKIRKITKDEARSIKKGNYNKWDYEIYPIPAYGSDNYNKYKDLLPYATEIMIPTRVPSQFGNGYRKGSIPCLVVHKEMVHYWKNDAFLLDKMMKYSDGDTIPGSYRKCTFRMVNHLYQDYDISIPEKEDLFLFIS